METALLCLRTNGSRPRHAQCRGSAKQFSRRGPVPDKAPGPRTLRFQSLSFTLATLPHVLSHLSLAAQCTVLAIIVCILSMFLCSKV